MHLLASHERTGSGSHGSNPTLLHMHWLLQRQRSLPCQWLNRGQQRANNHIACDITILCSAEIAERRGFAGRWRLPSSSPLSVGGGFVGCGWLVGGVVAWSWFLIFLNFLYMFSYVTAKIAVVWGAPRLGVRSSRGASEGSLKIFERKSSAPPPCVHGARGRRRRRRR